MNKQTYNENRLRLLNLIKGERMIAGSSYQLELYKKQLKELDASYRKYSSGFSDGNQVGALRKNFKEQLSLNEIQSIKVRVEKKGQSETEHLECYLSKTIEELKKFIQNKYKISAQNQCWFLGDKELKDNDNLLGIGINDDRELVVISRKKNNTNNQQTKKQQKSLGWTCSACTFFNNPTRPGCEMCSSSRPEDYRLPVIEKLSEEDRKRLRVIQKEEDEFLKFQQQEEETAIRERNINFDRLKKADLNNLILNFEEFDCPICLCPFEPKEGVIIRECLHTCCKDCLANSVKHAETSEVVCPSEGCTATLHEREIRELVDEKVLNNYQKKSIQFAEQQEQNSYHCKTADCHGWCIYEDEVNEFRCPVCKKNNCLLCKAIHAPQTCKEYQNEIKLKAEHDENAKATQAAFEKMIEEGDAMNCPGCNIIVQKKSGCDWIQCSMCRIEICWATKGPRWGPRGNGDTSGGCKCGGFRKRCHPNCGNCH